MPIMYKVQNPTLLNQKGAGYLVPSLAAANAATYSQTATTITVTSTGHTIPATTYDGSNVYLVIGTGLAATGWFTNFTRVDANSFTCVSTVSQSTSGTVNTNTAETLVTPVSTAIPAGAMGIHGSLVINEEFSYSTTATNKQLIRKIGAVTLVTTTRTSTGGHDSFTTRFRNRGSQASNSLYASSEATTSAATAQTLTTIDTSAAVTFTESITIAAASDYACLQNLSVMLLNAN